MSLWDRLIYRLACWWLDSPRVDRLRQRDSVATAKTKQQGDAR